VEEPVSNDARLRTALLEAGHITEEQLALAVDDEASSGKELSRVVVEKGLVEQSTVVAIIAEESGVDAIDLDVATIDPAAVGLVPEALLRRYTVLPVSAASGRLVVAMADPSNVHAIDDLRAVTGMPIEPRVAAAVEIEAALRRQSRFEDSVSDLAEMAADQWAEEDTSALEFAADEAPVVKLMNTIISRAVNDRASDIHIEPGETHLRVRFRIDGVLQDVMTSPRSIANAVVSRVKIMAELDIAERRLPQDGRMSLHVSNSPVDVRVATLPSLHGEKAVLRILDKSQGIAPLPDLGFLDYNLDRYRDAYTRPYGAILVTGPTGSGKTTTLYSTLTELNRPEVNIITVEDPIEYRLAGITQVQTNRRVGLTFATALKSILRSDPDIVLIGEIRDAETAKIATEAALTGHLVLSTLHTNDAPSSVGRLADMGVEPFLVSSAIHAVVAQRLARMLCDRCKEVIQPERTKLEELGWDEVIPEGAVDFYGPVGCGACARTGYRGRINLNEVMVVDEEIKRLIVERASATQIKKAAMENGMQSLLQDGLAKVAMGLTSLEEVLRVVV
jgi:type IV pilus assembly protein PilB